MTENFTKDKLNRAVLVGLSAHSLTREEKDVYKRQRLTFPMILWEYSLRLC